MLRFYWWSFGSVAPTGQVPRPSRYRAGDRTDYYLRMIVILMGASWLSIFL